MEKKALADEDIDRIPCPEEGFHHENDSAEDSIKENVKEEDLDDDIKKI